MDVINTQLQNTSAFEDDALGPVKASVVQRWSYLAVMEAFSKFMVGEIGSSFFTSNTPQLEIIRTRVMQSSLLDTKELSFLATQADKDPRMVLENLMNETDFAIHHSPCDIERCLPT